MRGFNGYKQVVGRKRHILVDTENSLLSAVSDYFFSGGGRRIQTGVKSQPVAAMHGPQSKTRWARFRGV